MRKSIRLAIILSLCVPSAFANQEANTYRAKIREWVKSHARRPLPTIAPEPNDRAADLVDELRYTNLARMEEAKLLAAQLPEDPWSGSYWPIYQGAIANRYGDQNFPAGGNWKENSIYLESALGKGGNEELSPAEKYDLLIGDSQFTLTKKMIRSGAPYAKPDGSLPTWFGLCHGWAPASFMEARPRHGIKVSAADGRELVFTQSDLKALTTLLWANGASETRFIGGRCNLENPPRDGNERDTRSDCFDTNPATWHLSVVNQIGVAKRSFVADISAASEVWNQPAVSYKYVYVNPLTGASGQSLEKAKVRLADWRADPFFRSRSPQAVYVVKIQMQFVYGAETSPSTLGEDPPELDSFATATYRYDLELDEQDNIVGGEWHTPAHPDFLWVPVKGGQASSEGDTALDRDGDNSSWNPSAALPASWKKAARLSSANSQPLARVVKRLLELSRN
jgi:hypothetical protein